MFSNGVRILRFFAMLLDEEDGKEKSHCGHERWRGFVCGCGSAVRERL